MILGEKIAQSRKENGLSQEDLAHRSGISIRTIQRIEKGVVSPHGHTLKTLASALDIDLLSLMESDKKYITFRKLRTLNSIGLLGILFPIFHLIAQLMYWNKNRFHSGFEEAGRKLISFQILWVLVVLTSFGCIRVGSLIIAGQNVVGHYPTRMTTYLVLLLINVVITLTNSFKLGNKDSSLLEKVPKLF